MKSKSKKLSCYHKIVYNVYAPVTADKSNVKPLSRNSVRFELVHLVFNSTNENYLAVAGYEECQVLTVNSRDEITDRLAIELALQGAYIHISIQITFPLLS